MTKPPLLSKLISKAITKSIHTDICEGQDIIEYLQYCEALQAAPIDGLKVINSKY